MRKSSPIVFACRVALIFSILWIPLSTQAGTVFEESFDTYPTGVAPVPPWEKNPTCQCGVVKNLVEDTFYYPSGKSLHLDDPGGGVFCQMYMDFAETDHVILEYYMLTHDPNDEGAIVYLHGYNIEEDKQVIDGAVIFSNGCCGIAAGYIGFWTRYHWEAQLLPYKTDTWYYVRREINLGTNTGSVYVEEVGNPSHNAFYERGWVDRADYFYRLLIDTSYSQGVDTFIDGIAVTSCKTDAVAIDIKPGSDPNSINLGSSGVITVAILSSDTFDATTVDPETISLAGARIKMVGKSGRYLAHEEDINGDGLIDLVCQVETAQFIIEMGESVAVLEAETFDGTSIRGEDIIRIVPDN